MCNRGCEGEKGKRRGDEGAGREVSLHMMVLVVIGVIALHCMSGLGSGVRGHFAFCMRAKRCWYWVRGCWGSGIVIPFALTMFFCLFI